MNLIARSFHRWFQQSIHSNCSHGHLGLITSQYRSSKICLIILVLIIEELIIHINFRFLHTIWEILDRRLFHRSCSDNSTMIDLNLIFACGWLLTTFSKKIFQFQHTVVFFTITNVVSLNLWFYSIVFGSSESFNVDLKLTNSFWDCWLFNSNKFTKFIKLHLNIFLLQI